MNGSIELLRHGDTGQRSYRGQLDDDLSELGWRQLREAVREGQWDGIVASSMRRCALFAEELATQRGLLFRRDPRLVEYHFGDWQGVPIEDLAKKHPDALRDFWADPVTFPPPGAETIDAFHARVSAALDQVSEEYAGKRVLVVTHGAVIRLVRCYTEQRPYGHMANIDVPHASLHPLAWPVSFV